VGEGAKKKGAPCEAAADARRKVEKMLLAKLLLVRAERLKMLPAKLPLMRAERLKMLAAKLPLIKTQADSKQRHQIACETVRGHNVETGLIKPSLRKVRKVAKATTRSMHFSVWPHSWFGTMTRFMHFRCGRIAGLVLRPVPWIFRCGRIAGLVLRGWSDTQKLAEMDTLLKYI